LQQKKNGGKKIGIDKAYFSGEGGRENFTTKTFVAKRGCTLLLFITSAANNETKHLHGQRGAGSASPPGP
jgi:hypothetical protein